MAKYPVENFKFSSFESISTILYFGIIVLYYINNSKTNEMGELQSIVKN